MADNSGKKKRRFQIKWWWDSDDERMAAQDPEYAKGLEKTDKIIEENDVEKDKIQDVKKEVMNEIQENKDANMADQQRNNQNTANGKKDDSNANIADQQKHDETNRKDDSGGWFGWGKQQKDADTKDQQKNGENITNGKKDDSNANTAYQQKDSNATDQQTNDKKDASKATTVNQQKNGENIANKKNGDSIATTADQQKHDETNRKEESGGWFGWGKQQKDVNARDQQKNGENTTNGKKDGSNANDARNLKSDEKKNKDVSSTDQAKSQLTSEKENSQTKQDSLKTKPSNDSYADKNKNTNVEKDISKGNMREEKAQESKSLQKDDQGKISNGGDKNKSSENTKKDEANQHNGKNGDSKQPTGSSLNSSEEHKKSQNENPPGTQNSGKDSEDKKNAQTNTKKTVNEDTEDKDLMCKSCYKILRLCALCNIIFIGFLLLATEVIWDCSVTFNQITLFSTIIIGIIPLILLIGKKNIISEIIGYLSVLVVIALLIYLFLNRVKVYPYFISINDEDPERLMDIQNQPWSQRWDSIKQILEKRDIFLERWAANSKKPGVKLFLLKHPLIYSQSEAFTFDKERFKRQIENETEMSQKLENKAVIISPIIRFNWSIEKSSEVLQILGSTKFSKLGTNYILIIGIFSNTTDLTSKFRMGIEEIDKYSIPEVNSYEPTIESSPKL